MGKANISFPDGLLDEIDRRASAGRTTRSGFVQEATAHYIADLEVRAALHDKERRVQAAMERMRAVAASQPSPRGDAVRHGRDALDLSL